MGGLGEGVGGGRGGGGGVDYTKGIVLACLRGLHSQHTSVVMICTYRASKPRPILFTHFNGSDCLQANVQFCRFNPFPFPFRKCTTTSE